MANARDAEDPDLAALASTSRHDVVRSCEIGVQIFSRTIFQHTNRNFDPRPPQYLDTRTTTLLRRE